jgi:uncharacterized Zn finger protein
MAPTRRTDRFDRGRFEAWPPPSKPLPADGIRARSRRGDIGETWWSRRFVAILESFELGGRLERGRRYARAGQVLDLLVEPGAVSAQVQGSRPVPYLVSIRTRTLSGADWGRVEEAMASRAVFLAKLLAGEMPRDIEEAFGAAGVSLFPASAGDLASECSCPDWSNPCKHIAATYYLLAEAFDTDPFLILRWRGRERDELLERLGARGEGETSEGEGQAQAQDLWDVPAVEVPPLADDLERFWEAGDEAEAGPGSPRRASVVPDALLRTLDPNLLPVAGRPLVAVLGPAYREIVASAERLRSATEPGRPDD